MEKFGVEEAVSEKKQGTVEIIQCPECGAELVSHGKLLFCPNHGSKPFESNERQAK